MKLFKNKNTDCHSESVGRGIHERKKSSLNQTNQRGRSMVEMLGVLAIIGVLSIGGVAGYRYAMTRVLENDILNLISTFRMSIDAEEGVEDSPYFVGESGSYITNYFCDMYLGSFCSKKRSENSYYFSGKNYWNANITDQYGGLFCIGFYFPSKNRELCQSLVAKTYPMDNIHHWAHYHHYPKSSHKMETIQDRLCRTENDGGKGENGIIFCFQ